MGTLLIFDVRFIDYMDNKRTTSEDRATQLLICEALSPAILIGTAANCWEFALEANVQTARDCQVAVKLVCIKMPITEIRRVS